MKYVSILKTIIICMICAYAQAEVIDREQHDNTFESHAGMLFNYAHFEFGSLPDYSGYLAGLHFDFEHRYKECIRTEARFDGLWNAGHICGCNDLKANINDFRTMLDVGYIFNPCSDIWHFIPFIGFQFLYLSNKLCPQNVQYRYYEISVPIGFLSEWDLYEDITVGLSFQYDIEAWQNLTVTSPELLPLIQTDCCESDGIKLTRSYGVHVEMPLKRKITHTCYDFTGAFVPFFDWQRFGKADKTCTTTPLAIPHLKQWYFGVHLDFGMSF